MRQNNQLIKNTTSSISWWDDASKDGLNMVKVADSSGKNNNKGTLNFN